jgi:hypothetical protein
MMLLCSHTYIHTYIHTHIHTCIHTHLQVGIELVTTEHIVHTYIHACMHTRLQVGIELVTIEHIVLAQDVPNTVHVPITEGAYITGLTLTGARWDTSSHSLAHHGDTSLYTAFPALQLRPCMRQDRDIDVVHSGENDTEADPVSKSLGAAQDNDRERGDMDAEKSNIPSGDANDVAAATSTAVDVAPAHDNRETDKSADAHSSTRDQPHANNTIQKDADAAGEPRGGKDSSKQAALDDGKRLASGSPYGKRQMYDCPVYRSARRADCAYSLLSASNNFVMNIPVPCAPEGAHNKGATILFVKRATALLIEGA